MVGNPSSSAFKRALEEFKQGLKKRDQETFKTTTFQQLMRSIGDLQAEQLSQRRLQNPNRLKPFLEAIEQYGKVVEEFCDSNDFLAFVWGPIKFLLQKADAYPEAFSEVLELFGQIGASLPLLLQHRDLFRAEPHMLQVLSLIYKDLLKFLEIALGYFQQPRWEQLFNTTWNTCRSRLSDIIPNMARNRSLIENHASSTEIENSREYQRRNNEGGEAKRAEENLRLSQAVCRWLRATNVNVDQHNLSKLRADYPSAGRWLLDNALFREWFDPQFPQIPPLLWLNGIPGAGKSVLASLVVEESRKLTSKPTVVFFYCKNGDPERDNFHALAVSVLSQLLREDISLLPYFYQKCCGSGEAVLSSPELVEELLVLAFRNCKSAYIIIDGLDECERKQRKDIAGWFKKLVEDLPPSEPDRLRCLFVSQDDGIARKDFSGLASIKIRTEDNKHDISEYSQGEVEKVKTIFELSDERANSIARTITDSVGGMFLLARLIWSNLSGQTSIQRFEDELQPNVFPKEINNAYQRIMVRIKQQASPTALEDILMLLRWLVCAKRPFKWHEIQGLVSINLDKRSVEFPQQKFVVDPKDLCESLVEIRDDGTIELVHYTAKSFLTDKHYLTDGHRVDPSVEELKLATRCIDYLNLPAFIEPPTKDGVLNGNYGFMDYAVLYWIRHLEAGDLNTGDHESLGNDLAESLEIFIDHHWNSPTTTFRVSNRTSQRLKFFKDFPFYKNLEQTVVATKKQLESFGETKKGAIALDLVYLVENVRKVLEEIVSSPMDTALQRQIEQKYGRDLFKCPRFSCRFFTTGFSSAEERDNHVYKHERPFRCANEGCFNFHVGFTSTKDLEKHTRETHPTAAVQGREFPTDEEVQQSIAMNRPELAAEAPIQATEAPIQATEDPIQATEDPIQSAESEPEAESQTTRQSSKRQRREVECHYCPKVFTKQYNLKSHLRTHVSNVVHSCRFCGKHFVRLSDLIRHINGHENARYFVCGGVLPNGDNWGCGASFSRADTLRTHYKSRIGQACLAQKEQCL